MTSQHRKVLIIGGGPAGLAAAYRLSRDGAEVHLVEKEKGFGGLARTIEWNSRSEPGLVWRADIGVHRLHSATDPAVMADLETLLGDDLLKRPRQGLIFLEGRRLSYPFTPLGILTGIRPATLLRCARDAALSSLRRPAGAPASYEDAVERRFGRTLSQIFYAPYAQKVWGVPASELSAIQATKRITTKGFSDLLLKALGRKTARYYYYPRKGYGQIAAAYESALRTRPNCRMYPSTRVTRFEIAGGVIQKAELQPEGSAPVTLDVDFVLWSGSMESIAQVLRSAAPPATNLEWRSGHILYVGMDCDKVGDADAYYFPTLEVPFNRVSDQKNFSASLVPRGKSLLCADFTDRQGAPARSAEDLFKEASPHLERHGLLKGRVLDVHSVSMSHVYPLYRQGYEVSVARQREWAEQFSNLRVFGRQGLFLHNNIHHSLLMGYLLADHVGGGGGRDEWNALLRKFDGFYVED